MDRPGPGKGSIPKPIISTLLLWMILLPYPPTHERDTSTSLQLSAKSKSRDFEISLFQNPTIYVFYQIPLYSPSITLMVRRISGPFSLEPQFPRVVVPGEG